MSETTYAGLDYGHGLANIDKETGIRYGVISQHSVGEGWWDGAEPEYGDPHCPECGGEVKASYDATFWRVELLDAHAALWHWTGSGLSTEVDWAKAFGNRADAVAEWDEHSQAFPSYEADTVESENPEWFDHKDYVCIACESCFWSDQCFPDEALGYSYDHDGYKLTDCLDSDIFVLQSPYFTYAQFCSPCVPGAGNLDSLMSAGEGAKCYALGHDWFDGGRAPYRVWSVETGLEVLMNADGGNG